jgi:hypothetical protein
MTVRVEDAHAHFHTLVSLVKMAIVLEKCITEEQRRVVRFFGQKDSLQMIFINKYFLFMLECVCRVQLFHLDGKYFGDGEEF